RDRDRVRDDVVQLTRDPPTLFRHGGASLCVSLELELDRALGEVLLALASEPHPDAGRVRASDHERGERDVAGVERVAVVEEEPRDARDHEYRRDPALASRRVGPERVEVEDEDDEEDARL